MNYHRAETIRPKNVSVPESLIEDIWYHLTGFDNSSSQTNAAYHLTELYNKVGDLKTWHSTYDYETGTIAYEREDLD